MPTCGQRSRRGVETESPQMVSPGLPVRQPSGIDTRNGHCMTAA